MNLLLTEESVKGTPSTLHDIDGLNEKVLSEDDQDEIIASLDTQLGFLESRILASAREDDSGDGQADTALEHDGDNRKKRDALKQQQMDQREDAPWIIADLPVQITTPAYAALEAFQIKKWRELLQLVSGLTVFQSNNKLTRRIPLWVCLIKQMKLMSAPCFHGIRLAGDDRALYEGFFRAFPHHLVTKARFTNVVRHIFGIPAVSVIHQRSKTKKSERLRRDRSLKEDNNAVDQESEKTTARLALDRHLEKLQFCCERSGDNVPVLNWKTLLIALRYYLS